jgi:hypothetical protein
LRADAGVLYVAKDDCTGKIIGYSSALLNDTGTVPEVRGNFVGISGRAEYRGFGIGGALITLRDNTLSQMGVTSYEASVNTGSYEMYKRIGADFVELPTDDGSLPGTKSTDTQNILIRMDEQSMGERCRNEYGITTNNNPHGMSYQVNLPDRAPKGSLLTLAGVETV